MLRKLLRLLILDALYLRPCLHVAAKQGGGEGRGVGLAVGEARHAVQQKRQDTRETVTMQPATG